MYVPGIVLYSILTTYVGGSIIPVLHGRELRRAGVMPFPKVAEKSNSESALSAVALCCVPVTCPVLSVRAGQALSLIHI